MLWIDRFEKIGRLVLWLTPARLLQGIAPIVSPSSRGAPREQAHEAARKEFKAVEKAAKDKAARSERLSLRSMGSIMRALVAQERHPAMRGSTQSSRREQASFASTARRDKSEYKDVHHWTRSLHACQLPLTRRKSR